ncbi:MAG: TGS domain-containing protein [Ruthenibacterium lactatiformans]
MTRRWKPWRYAPIAHRLGMSNVKEELEDRSLQYLDPVGYEEITSFLAQNGGADSFISGIADRIKERLAENGMDKCTIKKRIKSVYGIYRKMYMQNRTFEEIYDVYAVRIILDTVGECYNALGVIHDMYHPIPSRFKDYISTPKPNMYQSLHTTVIGHEGIPFEVQIRTWEMDQTAEYGVAAHWKYKAGVSTKICWTTASPGCASFWKASGRARTPVTCCGTSKASCCPRRCSLYAERRRHQSARGATVIDFAYAIHSAVGNRMVGAKVNSQLCP